MDLRRVLRHLLVPHWQVRQCFPQSTLQTVEKAIAASEKQHNGELRFVLEGGLPPECLWRDDTPRQRAAALFSQLRVWDTEDNSGILIYVQWVDRAVEILADRGVASKVPQSEWDSICRQMEMAFGRGEHLTGVLAAIERANSLLTTHFPSTGGGVNELSDKPLLL